MTDTPRPSQLAVVAASRPSLAGCGGGGGSSSTDPAERRAARIAVFIEAHDPADAAS